MRTGKMRTGIAYKLTFQNGKVYIGITRESLARRVQRHINYARVGKNYALSCAIRKHGEDSFVAEVVGSGTWEELKKIEIDLIANHSALGAGGYNMTGGGDGSLGVSLQEATKLKISSSLTGRKLSAEHRARLSRVQQGKVIPEKTREKMNTSAKLRARQPMPDEQREKRSKALKGRKRSPELMAYIWEKRRANASRQQAGDQHRPPSTI
jgi:group I intron endonuclease